MKEARTRWLFATMRHPKELGKFKKKEADAEEPAPAASLRPSIGDAEEAPAASLEPSIGDAKEAPAGSFEPSIGDAEEAPPAGSLQHFRIGAAAPRGWFSSGGEQLSAQVPQEEEGRAAPQKSLPLRRPKRCDKDWTGSWWRP